MAVRGSFAVATTMISDDNSSIFAVATLKLSSTDALQGEAHATLLAAHLVAFSGFGSFLLEGDALLIIFAINSPSLFSSWTFANYISNIRLIMSYFQSWNTLKVSQCVNFRAHALPKYATSNHVFCLCPVKMATYPVQTRSLVLA